MHTEPKRCPALTEDSTACRDAAPAAATSGYVALSRFVIANGMSASVKEAFRNRPHLVDAAEGDVLSPTDRPYRKDECPLGCGR